MVRKCSLITSLLLLALAWTLIACPTSLADTGEEPERPPGPDLTGAVLTADDLPASFRAALDRDVDESAPLLQELGVLLEDLTQAEIQNPTIFAREYGDQQEMLINLFVSPLNRAEQVAIDRVLSNPDVIAGTFEEQLGDVAALRAEPVPAGWALGERGFLLSAQVGDEPDSLLVEAVAMRRGPVLSILWDMRSSGSESELDIGSVARMIDERVAEALSAGSSPYRAAGTWVPELTTYIPTPLDISTDPKVLGANLGLAAVATILLTLVQELVNRTLEEHEDDILREVRRWRIFDRWTRREAQGAPPAAGRSGSANAVLFIVIALAYGLIFSLLDRNWDPFSVAGLYLFACMAFASGLAGLSGDMSALRAARRMGLPANMNVRPGNLLLATASAGASRLFGLVPGVWLGAPDAFDVDTEALGQRRALRLLLAGLRGLILVAATAWLLTIATTLGSSALSLLSRAVGAAARLAEGLGGLQSLLLLAFASVVQNIFLEMSGLPDTVGGALRKSNRLLWVLGLLVAVFVYYHALLNPQGDVAAALQSTSVRVFMLTVAGFTVLALAVWLYFRFYYRPPSAEPAGDA
jgi:hypothetical protein